MPLIDLSPPFDCFGSVIWLHCDSFVALQTHWICYFLRCEFVFGLNLHCYFVVLRNLIYSKCTHNNGNKTQEQRSWHPSENKNNKQTTDHGNWKQMMQSEPQHLKKQIANLHTLPTFYGIGAESDDSHANFGASTLPKFFWSANEFAKEESCCARTAPRSSFSTRGSDYHPPLLMTGVWIELL